MNLKIESIIIENFKSFKNIEVDFMDYNVVVGQNNSGKSNLMRAINVVLTPSESVYETDIYNFDFEDITESTIIVKIVPENRGEFDTFWTGVFTEDWIKIDPNDGNVVYIGLEIKYNETYDRFVKKYFTVNDLSVTSKRSYPRFTTEMSEYIKVFYVEAKRDILDDISKRKSFFGRSVRDNIDSSIRAEIEENIDVLNRTIIDNMPSISILTSELQKITETTTGNSKMYIEPINREVEDIQKGLNILYSHQDSQKMSIDNHGMGTRSWASILTLSAYTQVLENKKDEDENYFFLYLIEEPESHLHPQAQKKVLDQITDLNGQTIVNTHSPYILSTVSLVNLIKLDKKLGRTISSIYPRHEKIIPKELIKLYKEDVRAIDLENVESSQYQAAQETNYKLKDYFEELDVIDFHIKESRGEILFADSLLLFEGGTEHIILNDLYFNRFETKPYSDGVEFVSVDGNGDFKKFCKFADLFNIPWVILSDGESEAISILKDINNGENPKNHTNIFFFDDYMDIERYILTCIGPEGHTRIIDDLIKLSKSKYSLEKKVKGKFKVEFDHTNVDHIYYCLTKEKIGNAKNLSRHIIDRKIKIDIIDRCIDRVREVAYEIE